MEVSLHSHIGQHPNIIEWFATGEDAVWRWIAMEFADGGDLFDKIEAAAAAHPQKRIVNPSKGWGFDIFDEWKVKSSL